MPKRTNERQQIIELLKTLLAGPNCTVTASKLMRDSVTSAEREVDVVAEYDVDGDTFTQGFEVTSTSRPADVTWVEQLLRKHENLPTDRLVLVSWAGFTSTARRLADVNPRVLLVTPRVVDGPDGPRIKTLYVNTIQVSVTKTAFTVSLPDGRSVCLAVDPDHALYSPEKVFLLSAHQLSDALVRQSAQRMHGEAYGHPEREALRSFIVGVPLDRLQLHLYQEERDEFHHITLVEVTGGFAFKQEPLEMEIREFRNQYFAHGKAAVVGVPGTFVATLNEQLDITKAIVRFRGKAPVGSE